MNESKTPYSEEKERRIYYQDICYAVANQLEKANRETNGRHLIVVGTSASPATGLQNALQVLVDERDQLRVELERVKADNQYLKLCCDYTKDGKPVERGSILYLFPNDDTQRPPMTLVVPKRIDYCWFASPEDSRQAIDAAMREDGK